MRVFGIEHWNFHFFDGSKGIKYKVTLPTSILVLVVSSKKQLIDSKPDEVQIIFDYALSLATNMNELIIAAVFGIFGVLVLLQSTRPLSLEWIFLTVVYYGLVGLGVWLYGRSQVVSSMVYACMHGMEDQNVRVKPLVREEIYRAVYEGASKWTPIGRFMLKYFKIYETYLWAWKFWVPVSFLVVVLMWISVTSN